VYIGVNSAVHPPTGALDGNAIFAIMCVYLFVVFYSFGECLPRSATTTTKLTLTPRLGTHALYPELGMQPQSCAITDHGSIAHDAVAF
jgi:hypothetical protein